MTLSQLLDAAQAHTRTESDAALGRVLHVTRQAVSAWRRGESFPNWRACERLSQVSGIPLADVLSTVSKTRREARAVSRGWGKEGSKRSA